MKVVVVMVMKAVMLSDLSAHIFPYIPLHTINVPVIRQEKQIEKLFSYPFLVSYLIKVDRKRGLLNILSSTFFPMYCKSR